jgi:hypothetical protein
LKSDKNVAMDGKSLLFVEGEISQTLDKMAAGQFTLSLTIIMVVKDSLLYFNIVE